MGRMILKLTDPRDQREWYLEWSTITDSPVTIGMTYEEFLNWYADEYGAYGGIHLHDRMKRVNKTGCSMGGMNWKDVISSYAFAGDDETTLALLLRIIDKYCINRDSLFAKKVEDEKAS